MRKVFIILIISITTLEFICCSKSNGRFATNQNGESSLMWIENTDIENPRENYESLFPFDSAVIIIPSDDDPSEDDPFIFHFWSPKGGEIEYIDHKNGHRYTSAISEEFSYLTFKALDSLFLQKSVPFIKSRKEAECVPLCYTPPDIIFKIFRDNDVIVNEKITFSYVMDGYDITYTPLFDKLACNLLDIRMGMIDYWFKFKPNAE